MVRALRSSRPTVRLSAVSGGLLLQLPCHGVLRPCRWHPGCVRWTLALNGVLYKAHWTKLYSPSILCMLARLCQSGGGVNMASVYCGIEWSASVQLVLLGEPAVCSPNTAG